MDNSNNSLQDPIQYLYNFTKLHLEISKAGDYLWHISLLLPDKNIEETKKIAVSTNVQTNVLLEDKQESQEELNNSPKLSTLGSSSDVAADSSIKHNLDPTISEINPINFIGNKLPTSPSLHKQKNIYKRNNMLKRFDIKLYESFPLFSNLLINNNFNKDEIKNICNSISHNDFIMFNKIDSLTSISDVIAEFYSHLHRKKLMSEFIRYIKKHRHDIKLNEYLG